VLPHSGGSTVEDFDRMGVVPSITLPPLSSAGVEMGGEFEINGVICNKEKCEVVTPSGLFVVGDMLPSGEKVTAVTKEFVATSNRKINF
jgi:hypothetical protein